VPRNDLGSDSLAAIAQQAEAIADDFERFLGLLLERFDAALADANDRLADYIRTEWSDHGSISEDVSTEQVGRFAYRLEVDNPGAKPLEYGTSPHVITPNPGTDYLHFKVDGNWVKTVRVDHPGQDADPALRPGIDRIADELVEQLQQIVRETETEVFG